MNFLIFLSTYILPFFIFYVVAYGLWKGRNVYQVFAEGAKGGFSTAIGILPTLVGLLAAVGVLRASGFLDFLSGLLKGLLKGTSFPVELLPLAVVRLFSNSAATGLALDLFKTYGPDSQQGLLASLFLSSTETVFYTMSIYFMSIKIKRTRYTLSGALLASLAGWRRVCFWCVFCKSVHVSGQEEKIRWIYGRTLGWRAKFMGSVFGGSHLLIMPENFDKIAGIGKAAAVGDLGNTLIGIGKLFAGNLDAVIIQIVHWRAVGEFFEIAAEITGIQVRTAGEDIKRQVFAVTFFDKGKNRLQVGKTTGFF